VHSEKIKKCKKRRWGNFTILQSTWKSMAWDAWDAIDIFVSTLGKIHSSTHPP